MNQNNCPYPTGNPAGIPMPAMPTSPYPSGQNSPATYAPTYPNIHSNPSQTYNAPNPNYAQYGTPPPTYSPQQHQGYPPVPSNQSYPPQSQVHHPQNNQNQGGYQPSANQGYPPQNQNYPPQSQPGHSAYPAQYGGYQQQPGPSQMPGYSQNQNSSHYGQNMQEYSGKGHKVKSKNTMNVPFVGDVKKKDVKKIAGLGITAYGLKSGGVKGMAKAHIANKMLNKFL